MRAACRSIASPPKATAGPDAASAANPTAAAANIDRCICDTSEIYLHTLGFGRLKSTSPADDVRVVVGDGLEGLVLHGDAVHPLGFVGTRCQRSNGRSESDEVANECHPSRGGAAEFDAIPPEVEGSGANHQDEGRP